jgi:hypothetical protein
MVNRYLKNMIMAYLHSGCMCECWDWLAAHAGLASAGSTSRQLVTPW